MNKQTVEQIIQELKWKNGKYNPNPSYVIFGKRKSMYLSTTEYIIKFDNNYIRGIHRKNNNLVSIQYKSVTKIVELKQIYIGKDYKSLEIIEPTENQEITVGIPFDVEVHADSQSPLKIYYNGHLIGTLNFVNGVATGQITLSEEYVDSIGGEYYVIDDDTLIPANDLEGKLVFVSGDYAGNVNVKIMPYDKFSQGEAYISDTHTEIKTDNVWSNSELMRGIIPSNHIIPSDLHEQGEAIVSVEVA